MSGQDVRATPFHARTAVLNRGNNWLNRNGWTLAAGYGDANAEALAARMSAVMADITWRWRTQIEGARAAEFLSQLVTKDASRLSPGQSLKVLWLTDGGGVRGAGAIARFGQNDFLLAASAPDFDWVAHAAARFGVNVRDVSENECGLALIGPYAGEILKAAGLDAGLEPLAFRKLFWRGLDVTLSRWGEHGGFEIWCKADDAFLVWDRIVRAGEAFGLLPAGIEAMDILDLEKGIARPGRDYKPARDGFAAQPTPHSLALESLIDDEHKTFNGRAAYLAGREKETKHLIGIESDSETPTTLGMLRYGEQNAGRILACGYSTALRRAIALAQVEAKFAKPGTVFLLVLPQGNAVARAVELPFLETPVLIAP